MLKSKRFLSFLIETLIFVIGTFFFHVPPLELAGGLTMIFTPYQIAESFRQSDVTIKTETK